MSVCLSICTEQICTHCRDFHEIWYLRSFLKSVEKIHVLLKSDKNNWYLTWRPTVYLYHNISLNSSWSKKFFRENWQKKSKHTYSVQSLSFWKSCHSWGNVEKYGRARQAADNNVIRCMHTACWITRATDTHSDYLILIACTWRQGLCNHTSVLHYTYIACFIIKCIFSTEFISFSNSATSNRFILHLISICEVLGWYLFSPVGFCSMFHDICVFINSTYTKVGTAAYLQTSGDLSTPVHFQLSFSCLIWC
jgi:hypothetical protein